MKPYQTYTTKDFAMDDFFQDWVLNADQKARTFWESWLEEHPEKRETIANARELVLFLTQEENISHPQDEMEVWSTINQALQSNEKQLSPKPFKIPWYYVAASVSLLLIGALGYWTIFQQNQQMTYTTSFAETMQVLLPDSSLVTLNANFEPEFQERLGALRKGQGGMAQGRRLF